MFDVKAYLKGEEFENIEFDFKEVVSHMNYEIWAKEISAFANGRGGCVFLESKVSDRGGHGAEKRNATLRPQYHLYMIKMPKI